MNVDSQFLSRILPCLIKSVKIGDFGKCILFSINKDKIYLIIKFIKLHFENTYVALTDIVVVDNIIEPRFQLNYVLFNFWSHIKFIVGINISLNEPIDSIMDILSSANWLEREIWDMFGIYFSNHKDLRRILCDYGFSGFPLRKDFPLSGYVQVRYDTITKRVVSEPLLFSQEFRLFNFLLPWRQNLFKIWV